MLALLPDHSHYKVSIHDDDELARRAREQQPEAASQSARPRVDAHTWTPERAALTDVADLLIAIRASLEAQRTGKRQNAKPMPRPVLAADRLDEVEAYGRHLDRVRLMLPNRR